MGNVDPNLIIKAVAAAANAALSAANQSPSVPVSMGPATQAAIAQEIVERVEADPGVQHVTSTEEWYQSRANWSAIVGALTPIVAIAGYNLTPEYQEATGLLLGTAGGWVAAYLARRARTASKPLNIGG